MISGGGTGGHIFPAIAIANALRVLEPDCEILFVGAAGKMEMEKVPAAGYKIVGLDIQGINRSSWLKNLALPFKLVNSLRKSYALIRKFRPDVAIGVGGYASGPLLIAAGRRNVPTVIQEQNSYAGVTNKRLAAKASLICVAFEGMEKFFPADRLLITGNPVRQEVVNIQGKDFEAKELFGLNKSKKTVLVTGGSLGARTLNQSLLEGLQKLDEAGIQVIWQTGAYYYETLMADERVKNSAHLFAKPFLYRMDLAYAAADVIIARAGAGTIAELAAVGKAVILVPSPNVAEDHQTKNAKALASKNAALLVSDAEAAEKLIDQSIALLNNRAQMEQLAANIRLFAKIKADEVIAKAVLKIIEHRREA